MCYNVKLTLKVQNSKSLRLDSANAQLLKDFELLLDDLCWHVINQQDMHCETIKITYERDIVSFVKSFELQFVGVPESDFTGSRADQYNLSKPAWEFIEQNQLNDYLKVHATSYDKVEGSETQVAHTSTFEKPSLINYEHDAFKNLLETTYFSLNLVEIESVPNTMFFTKNCDNAFKDVELNITQDSNPDQLKMLK